MDVRPFPTAGASRRARDHALDIEQLLALTNTRLAHMTGNPDVLGTRMGLRHLQRLGMKALVLGAPFDAVPPGWRVGANDGR